MSRKEPELQVSKYKRRNFNKLQSHINFFPGVGLCFNYVFKLLSSSVCDKSNVHQYRYMQN